MSLVSYLAIHFIKSFLYTYCYTCILETRSLVIDLAHLQIALRREKPDGRTITSPPQEISKLDLISDDEDETTPAETVSNLQSTNQPQGYDPAPDVRILLKFRRCCTSSRHYLCPLSPYSFSIDSVVICSEYSGM